MLFNNNNIFLESDKERNLYFKVFGGCIFNELIPSNFLGGIFIEKLISTYDRTCNWFEIEKDINVENKLKDLKADFYSNKLSLTFDFHLYRAINCSCSDRGEMADIFISGSKSFVAIEAKYTKCYDYDKDIEKNGARISKACNEHQIFGIQVLLVTKGKWTNSVNQSNKKESNYKKLYNYVNGNVNPKVPFILLLWEDVLDVISADKNMDTVHRFLANEICINK